MQLSKELISAMSEKLISNRICNQLSDRDMERRITHILFKAALKLYEYWCDYVMVALVPETHNDVRYVSYSFEPDVETGGEPQYTLKMLGIEHFIVSRDCKKGTSGFVFRILIDGKTYDICEAGTSIYISDHFGMKDQTRTYYVESYKNYLKSIDDCDHVHTGNYVSVMIDANFLPIEDNVDLVVADRDRQYQSFTIPEEKKLDNGIIDICFCKKWYIDRSRLSEEKYKHTIKMLKAMFNVAYSKEDDKKYKDSCLFLLHVNEFWRDNFKLDRVEISFVPRKDNDELGTRLGEVYTISFPVNSTLYRESHTS